MKKFWWVMVLLCHNALFAQQRELDSLLRSLNKHPAEDSVKLNLLLDISFDYSNIDPQKGLAIAGKAIFLSHLLNNKSKLASAYNYKALNYAAQGNDTTALNYYFSCLALREQLPDRAGLGVVLHNIGISYFNTGDYPKALDYQQKATTIFEKSNNLKGVAAALNSTGVVYFSLADYPKALDYYLQALRIYEKINAKYNMANIFTNIGLVYDHLNNYPKSLEYHLKARDIQVQSGDQHGLQNTLGNIGNTYDDAGNPGKALEFYHQALDINNRLKNNRGIASDQVNMGITYYGICNYSKALEYLKPARDLYTRLDYEVGLVAVYTYLAAVCANAPDSLLEQNGIAPSRRYATAVAYQKKGLQLAKQTGNLSIQSDSWDKLGSIYEKQKDYAAALAAYKNHALLRDSVMNEDKKSEIMRMEMQYEFDKREAVTRAANDKKQALAAAEINRQRITRNAFAGGALILLVAGASIFFFYKKRRDAEDQQKEAEFRTEVADTEMKALRAQMNPHFIFNSLNSIGDYIEKHDTQNAGYYLTRFARLMRMILENSEQKEIPLAEDLKALEAYMQLEASRLNNKFTFAIEVDKAINQETTMVPPLMLQPFVENSIWHGIAPKKGEGKIIIQIKREEEMINCIVEDNGIGRNKSYVSNQAWNAGAAKSMGMKITRARIDIMNKIKRSKAGVELSDLSEGLRVELRLPLELSF